MNFALIISSYLLINTTGIINSKNLLLLSCLTTLQDNIRFNAGKIHLDILSQMMPRLNWIMRDIDSKNINTNSYFEDFLLNDWNENYEIINLKKTVASIMRSRDCFGISPPYEFRNGKKYDDKFLEGVQELKNLILSNNNKKKMNGISINQRMAYDYIRLYVEKLNDNQVINLESM